MIVAKSSVMRFAKRKTASGSQRERDSLKIGFVPTIDCALLIAAQELGLYTKYGLTVRLSREVGWATIREKFLHEELDAAGAHASMAFSIYCGISVVRRPCLTALLLGLNASAITLSNNLWDAGVRDAATLGSHIRKGKNSRPLNFGVVLDLSSQNYHLRHWLRSGSLDPDRDVQITIIPSVLVYESFREGYLDGYCVAEPWNSAAIFGKNGWVPAVTRELNLTVPEKVLLVLQDFAEKREEEHLRLIAALMEASEFCDVPANRPILAGFLARSQYFDLPQEILENALAGPFDSGRSGRLIPAFPQYDSLTIGKPSRAMGKRTFELVRELGPKKTCAALHTEMIGKVFREDIFNKAKELFLSSRGANSNVGGIEHNAPPIEEVPRPGTPAAALNFSAAPLAGHASNALCA